MGRMSQILSEKQSSYSQQSGRKVFIRHLFAALKLLDDITRDEQSSQSLVDC
jgi:hypothetical protein